MVGAAPAGRGAFIRETPGKGNRDDKDSAAHHCKWNTCSAHPADSAGGERVAIADNVVAQAAPPARELRRWKETVTGSRPLKSI